MRDPARQFLIKSKRKKKKREYLVGGAAEVGGADGEGAEPLYSPPPPRPRIPRATLCSASCPPFRDLVLFGSCMRFSFSLFPLRELWTEKQQGLEGPSAAFADSSEQGRRSPWDLCGVTFSSTFLL